MRGVLLAGGSAKRLWPLTKVTNKHLLKIHKKPMIYYPLETLLKAGIKNILIITNAKHVYEFSQLLGSGKRWGAQFSYQIQQETTPGTGAAIALAKNFVGDCEFIVALGDNIINEDITPFVEKFQNQKKFKAQVLLANVDDPECYGVSTVVDNIVIQLIEKPLNPNSNLVNTGVWMFRSEIFAYLKKLQLSPRGEYEVTDVLGCYAENGELTYSILKSEWIDAGTFHSFFRATLLMKQKEEAERTIGL